MNQFCIIFNAVSKKFFQLCRNNNENLLMMFPQLSATAKYLRSYYVTLTKLALQNTYLWTCMHMYILA
jgi:hypothetical protein